MPGPFPYLLFGLGCLVTGYLVGVQEYRIRRRRSRSR